MPDIVFIYCIMLEVVDQVRMEFKVFDHLRLTKSSANQFIHIVVFQNCQLVSIYLDKSFQVRASVGFLDLGLTIKTIKIFLQFT